MGAAHSFGSVPAPPKPKVWPWILLGLAMVACVAGYGGFRVYQRFNEYKDIAKVSADRFHQQMDANQIEQIVAEAAPGFREGTRKEELVATLAGIREKMGTFKSGKQSYMQWNAQTGVGTTLMVRYESEFSAGKAQETFTLLLKDGGALLYGYNVSSPVLLKK